jgi:type III restriction enzyme
VAPAVIENPILNSPFREPTRHWKFTDEGITSEVEPGRRRSTYFIPIAKPRKTTTAGQLALAPPEGWTAERMTENDFINRVRDHVAAFRRARYPGVTAVTRELLEYWTAEDREKRFSSARSRRSRRRFSWPRSPSASSPGSRTA